MEASTVTDAQTLIKILESRETWVFGEVDESLYARAKQLAAKIVTDVHAAKSVPIHSWLLFVAHLPYGESLEALSDLALVLPRVLEQMVQPQTGESIRVNTARHLLIERLNILLRQQLHHDILTQQRRDVINTVLRAYRG